MAVRSGCVAPGQYERPAVPIAGSSPGSITIDGFPDSGQCHFRLNAGAQDEWTADFTALSFRRALPGSVSNLNVAWSPTPVVAASVTVTNINQYAEFDIALMGAVDFRLTAPTGQQFDYCTAGGVGIPTTPGIGVNGDGVRAGTITIRGPVSGRCDFDTSSGGVTVTFSGMTVVVGGVSKPLVRSGTVWSTSF